MSPYRNHDHEQIAFKITWDNLRIMTLTTIITCFVLGVILGVCTHTTDEPANLELPPVETAAPNSLQWCGDRCDVRGGLYFYEDRDGSVTCECLVGHPTNRSASIYD